MQRLFVNINAVGMCLVLLTASAFAQTAPCGRSSLQTGGEKKENRFVSAPLEQVKSAIIKALPSVDARLKKEEGNHLKAAVDMEIQYKQLGSEKFRRGSSGTFQIDLTPDTENGVAGTRLSIDFSKGFAGAAQSGKYPTPLADETVCLVSLFGAADPFANPRGPIHSAESASTRVIHLKAGTPVKTALFNYFMTKDVAKDTSELEVPLVVLEDVRVDNVVVIRKGALAKGKFIGLSRAKVFGREAAFNFVVESATAIDGQEIMLSSPIDVEKHTTKGQVALGLIGTGLMGGFIKGDEVFVRAGTEWDLVTAQDIAITGAQ